MDEVKAALAALQDEIQEAKKKVNRAEERLEKAIEEGKPVDVRADLFSFLLTQASDVN